MIGPAWAVLLAGCTSGEPTAPPPPAPPAPVVAPVAPATRVVATVGGEHSVDVELEFYSVGKLYQSFFAKPEAVGKLGAALGACLDGPAQVAISYDNDTRVGRIVLKVPPGASRCVPAIEADALDLAPVVPLGTALAGYRDAVAAAYDVRVSSFRVILAYARGARSCELLVSGQHPPDGSTFAPCVDTREKARCAAGGPEGVTRLAFADAEDRRYVEGCFE